MLQKIAREDCLCAEDAVDYCISCTAAKALNEVADILNVTLHVLDRGKSGDSKR